MSFLIFKPVTHFSLCSILEKILGEIYFHPFKVGYIGQGDFFDSLLSHFCMHVKPFSWKSYKNCWNLDWFSVLNSVKNGSFHSPKHSEGRGGIRLTGRFETFQCVIVGNLPRCLGPRGSSWLGNTTMRECIRWYASLINCPFFHEVRWEERFVWFYSPAEVG